MGCLLAEFKLTAMLDGGRLEGTAAFLGWSPLHSTSQVLSLSPSISREKFRGFIFFLFLLICDDHKKEEPFP